MFATEDVKRFERESRGSSIKREINESTPFVRNDDDQINI